jgi:hypothetical protein
MARRGLARRGKARPGWARQGKARQGKVFWFWETPTFKMLGLSSILTRRLLPGLASLSELFNFRFCVRHKLLDLLGVILRLSDPIERIFELLGLLSIHSLELHRAMNLARRHIT